MDEAPELHSASLLSVTVLVHHHSNPAIEVLGQGDGDVASVADQVIRGHAQGIDAVYELLHDFLVITSLVGTRDDDVLGLTSVRVVI